RMPLRGHFPWNRKWLPGSAGARSDGRWRDLEIGHKRTKGLFSGQVGPLMFEEKGRGLYVYEKECACCGLTLRRRVRRERAQRLSKGDAAADGFDFVRNAGKGIEERSRRIARHGRTTQKDSGAAVPGIRVAERSAG